MKENVKIYTLSSLMLLCILSLGGGFSEPLALIVRLIAFTVPTLLALWYSKASSDRNTAYLSLDKRGLLLLPLLVPSLLVIFGLSFLVSLVIYSITGAQADVPISGNVVFDVFSLAVVPAVTEEMFFRYVPLKIIAPLSKKSALIISSVFFAVIHTSFFSIPYALAAGVIFMTFDLITESVLPSVIVHLFNNIMSLVWMYGADTEGFAEIYLSVFVLGAVISIIPLIISLKKYRRMLRHTFEKDDKLIFPAVSLALIIPTLLIALMEFI